jgi:hypothetical protein
MIIYINEPLGFYNFVPIMCGEWKALKVHATFDLNHLL